MISKDINIGKLFDLSDIIKQAKEGKTNIGALVESIKAYKTATASAIPVTQVLGTAIKSVLISTGIGIAINIVVSLIYKAIDAIANYKDKIREMADESKAIIKELKSSLDSSTSTVNEVKNRYAELAQKVDPITGENNLSTDEYQEFVDISKQLLDIFPQLYNGLDDNGNAFLKLSGDVDTIVSSLDNLIKKETELTNIRIVEETPKFLEGIEQQVQAYKDERDLIKEQKQEAVNKAQQEIFNTKDLFFSKDSDGRYMQYGDGDYVIETILPAVKGSDISQYEKELREQGIEYIKKQIILDDYSNGYAQKKVYFQFDYDTSLLNIKELTDEADEVVGRVEYEYDQSIKAVEDNISNSFKEINPLAQTWVETSSLTYKGLDEPFKKITDIIISGLDFENIGTNEDQIRDYINNNILKPLSHASPDVKKSFGKLFDMKESFQNGEITKEEFSIYVNSMFNDLLLGMNEQSSSFQQLLMNGFLNMGVEGNSFDAIIDNIINSWNIQVDKKADDFYYFPDSYPEKIKEYKDELSSLSDWQTDFITNGFLPDDVLYDLQNKYSGIFDFTDFNNTKDYNTMFSALREKIIEELINPLNALLEDVNVSDKVKDSIRNTIDLIQNMSDVSTDSINGLQSYADSIDNIQNAYVTVADAIEEYNKNKYLSLDTLQSLLALDDEYLAVLFNENGQLQLNKETYIELTKAKILELYTTLQREAIKTVDRIKNEKDALNNLKEITTESAEENWDLVDSIYEVAKAELEAEKGKPGTNPFEIQAKIDALNESYKSMKARENLLKNGFENININLDGMMRTPDSKDKKETKEFSDTIDWLDNSVNNLSDSIDKLNSKLDNSNLSYEERKKIIEELITQQEKLVNLNKQGVEIYQTEYDKSLNALGKNKNKYKSLIESDKEVSIELFEGEDREKIFNLVKTARENWNKLKEQKNSYLDSLSESEILRQEDYENQISSYDNLISRHENGKQDRQNKLELKKSKGLTLEESDYKNVIDSNTTLLDLNQKKLNIILAERDYIAKNFGKDNDRYKELDSTAQEVQNTISQLTQEQIDLNREMLKLPIQALEEEKKLLEEHLKVIQEKEEKLNTSINTASNYIGKQIEYYNELKDATSESYDNQIKQWQEKIDLLTETNDEIKQQMALEKAQYEYQKSIENKNVKIYREGQGFVYEADQNAVRDSKQALEEEQLNKQIRSYEKEIKLLEEYKEKDLERIDNQVKALEQYKQLIDEISSSYEEMLGLQQLISQYGEDVIERLNSGDLSLINLMRDNYIDIQADKQITEEKLEGINGSIEEITELADSWEGNAERIELAKQKIQQVVEDNSSENKAIKERVDKVKDLSKEWGTTKVSIKEDLDLINKYHEEATTNEKEILDGRLENIKSFAIQAQSLLSSITSQLSAAKEKQSELEQVNNKIANDSKNNSNNKSNDKLEYHIGMKKGFIGKSYTNKDKENFRYISLNELKPDEVPAILQVGEGVLTTAQQGNIMNNIKSAFVSGTQQFSNIPKITPAAPNTISFNGDIVIEKVNGDVNEFAQKVKLEFLSRLEQQLFKL